MKIALIGYDSYRIHASRPILSGVLSGGGCLLYPLKVVYLPYYSGNYGAYFGKIGNFQTFRIQRATCAVLISDVSLT